MRRWKRILLWALFAAAAITALVFTMVKDFSDPVEASNNITSALKRYWWYLFLAIAMAIAYMVLRGMTHAVMMHTLTGKIRFGTCMYVAIIGRFYDNITPFATGGQPFQIAYLQKKNLPEGTAIALPVVEYVISRFAFVMVSIVAIALCAADVFVTTVPMKAAIYIAAIVGLVLNFGFPLLIIVSLISRRACIWMTRVSVKFAKVFRLTKDSDALHQKVMSKLESNIVCMKTVFKKKRVIWCFVFSIFSSLAMASIGYFVIKAFGYASIHGWGWAEIVMLNMLIINSVAFVPTPGNSGAADLSFYWMFNSVILGAGAVATLIWRILSYYAYIIVGFALVMIAAFRKKKQILVPPGESVSTKRACDSMNTDTEIFLVPSGGSVST